MCDAWQHTQSPLTPRGSRHSASEDACTRSRKVARDAPERVAASRHLVLFCLRERFHSSLSAFRYGSSDTMGAFAACLRCHARLAAASSLCLRFSSSLTRSAIHCSAHATRPLTAARSARQQGRERAVYGERRDSRRRERGEQGSVGSKGAWGAKERGDRRV